MDQSEMVAQYLPVVGSVGPAAAEYVQRTA
jgi:hypothetical protein